MYNLHNIKCGKCTEKNPKQKFSETNVGFVCLLLHNQLMKYENNWSKLKCTDIKSIPYKNYPWNCAEHRKAGMNEGKQINTFV